MNVQFESFFVIHTVFSKNFKKYIIENKNSNRVNKRKLKWSEQCEEKTLDRYDVKNNYSNQIDEHV